MFPDMCMDKSMVAGGTRHVVFIAQIIALESLIVGVSAPQSWLRTIGINSARIYFRVPTC